MFNKVTEFRNFLLTFTAKRNIIMSDKRKSVIYILSNYIILHNSVTVNRAQTFEIKLFAKAVLTISERKRPLTDYGIEIKVQLLKLNKTQAWLISEVKKLLPDKYLDSSNLYKIMTGEINSPDIVSAIDQILDLHYTHTS